MALDLIFSAQQVHQQAQSLVGGKALQLSHIPQGSWAIPPWHVLSSLAWQQQCIYTGWAKTWPEQVETLLTLDTESAAFADICEDKQLEIEDTPLIARIDDALDQWWETVEKTPHGWAVRSSLAAEDARKSSFARIMDKFLFQQDLAQIILSIRKCWASAFSVRSLSYRLEHGVSIEEILPAIILQHMIPSDISGHVYTANPLDGRRDEARIIAISGISETLVEEEKETESYVIDLATGEWKEEQQPFETAVLTQKDTDRVIDMAEALAKHAGSPQDIEWALWKQQLYVLQARPITALPPPPYDPASQAFWDNSRLPSQLKGLTTPLVFSLVNRTYATTCRETMRWLGISEKRITHHEVILQNLLGLIQGRIYYRVPNWYKTLALLPFFEQEDLEKVMGWNSSFHSPEPLQNYPESEEERVEKQRLSLRILKVFRQMDTKAEEFMNLFEQVLEDMNQGSFHRLDLIQLMDRVEYLDKHLLNRWHIPIMNDLMLMRYYGQMTKIQAKQEQASPVGKVWFQTLQEQAQAALKNQQNIRQARSRLRDLYQALYTEIGRRFAFAHILEEAQDVFYLTAEELEAYRYGRSVNARLGAIAQLRKEEFVRYQDQELPAQFETLGPVYHHNRYDMLAKERAK